jgi:class 3 adenylate cyclase
MQMPNDYACSGQVASNDHEGCRSGALIDVWRGLGLPPTHDTRLRSSIDPHHPALMRKAEIGYQIQRLPVERCSISVLIVDIVGYSCLIELDNLGTAHRVVWLHDRLLEPIAVAHGGRIANTSGDGALLTFACMPDALACAVTIQRDLDALERMTAPDRRLRLRMGMSAGEVVAIDGMLHGHAINVAARLMALAEPGDICVCEVVLNHLGERFAECLEPLGVKRLRNIARPIRAFRVARTLLTDGVSNEAESTSWCPPMNTGF